MNELGYVFIIIFILISSSEPLITAFNFKWGLRFSPSSNDETEHISVAFELSNNLKPSPFELKV